MASELTAVILAGGRSTRFGSDKACALLLGRPLLQWVVDATAPWCQAVVIVAARGQVLPLLTVAEGVDVEVVQDFVDAAGPLAGLVAGLRAVRTPLAFAVSCDAPLVEPEVISLLAFLSPDYDAVVPLVEGRLQPLVAVYRRDPCLAAFERSLVSGERKLTAALGGLTVLSPGAGDLLEVDPALQSFRSVNDGAQLAAIEVSLRPNSRPR